MASPRSGKGSPLSQSIEDFNFGLSDAATPSFDFHSREMELRKLNAKIDAKKSEVVSRAEALVREQGIRMAAPPSPLRSLYGTGASASTSLSPAAGAGGRDGGFRVGMYTGVDDIDGNDGNNVDGSTAEDDKGDDSRLLQKAADFDVDGLEAGTPEGSTLVGLKKNKKSSSLLSGTGSEGDTRAANRSKTTTTSKASNKDLVGRMGKDATLRYQKAQIQSLEANVGRLAEENKKNKTVIRDLREEVATLTSAQRKLEKAVLRSDTKAERLLERANSAEAKCVELEQASKDAMKDLRAVEANKANTKKHKAAQDVRMNRLVTELANAKEQIAQLRREAVARDGGGGDGGLGGGASGLQEELQAVRSENRRLLLQRNELVVAFKKQLKLIDVLKRQKMHVEAATMLAFTEAEFARTLEVNE